MAALNLQHRSQPAPADFPGLLDLLAQRPAPAVIWYSGDGDRVELSGRVLANWVTKLIGLFDQESELSQGDAAVVDMPAHWKACAVSLALGAVGVEVTAAPADAGAALVVSDRPDEWLAGRLPAGAELAALSTGMLDESFQSATGEQIPPWVLDVSAEVRSFPDQLLSPLEPHELPHRDRPASAPVLITEWKDGSYEELVAAAAHSVPVVLFSGEPAGEHWEQMRRNEGLCGD
ncbi:TIGR03089 family protein [Nesterenkonia sp.]|uniref:TIGR03089 family protein n=1 Tax=Nesterenkonia sp. TaxID=704201 RepID=UPI00262DA882|nr:TIGR03089 family protein [Nesterenkonia sp.]